jgi:hypothetical protein
MFRSHHYFTQYKKINNYEKTLVRPERRDTPRCADRNRSWINCDVERLS